MLAVVLIPLDHPNPGSQLNHFVGGLMEEPKFGACYREYLFPSSAAQGNSRGVPMPGPRPENTGDFLSCASRKVGVWKSLPAAWFAGASRPIAHVTAHLGVSRLWRLAHKLLHVRGRESEQQRSQAIPLCIKELGNHRAVNHVGIRYKNGYLEDRGLRRGEFLDIGALIYPGLSLDLTDYGVIEQLQKS